MALATLAVMGTARSLEAMATLERARTVGTAGVVLGMGVGGLIDGIVFHQILQWHHLICFSCHPGATVDDVRKNILADGLFSLVVLGLTIAGISKLWLALREGWGELSRRFLLGVAAVGWGAFNLIEGTIDHHILEIHHVRPGPHQLFYDIAFLAFGAALVLAGLRLSGLARGRVPA